MIPFLKRYSTYANLVSGIVAALVAFVPSLGLDAQLNAYLMLSFNVVIALCQVAKQSA